jgi:lysophospholipase L1-like esterase
MLRKIILLSVAVLFNVAAHAQEKHPFENEIKELIQGDSLVIKRNIILFTGSSSIKMWTDLEKDFKGKNVLNRGFGGSTMRDLLYFADELIVAYNPISVFIYEGDNDIGFANRTAKEILASADSLLKVIRTKLPKSVKVYFISAKPSIARWHLKEQYESFNKKLDLWTQNRKNVYFIDVWSPMINANGTIRKELFLEDDLHMNRAGYHVWLAQIRPFVN